MSSLLRNCFLLLMSLFVLTACSETSIIGSVPEGQLVIEPVSSTISVGTTQQYTATLIITQPDEQAKSDQTRNVEWASTNPEVATVDQTGLVTAIAEGTAQIVATLGSYRGRAQQTVTGKPITELTIQPVQQFTVPGIGVQYSVVARFEDNTSQDVTFDSVWASSDDAIATVDEGGFATGVSAGTASISANFGGMTAEATLDVVDSLVDRVIASPFITNIHAGGQVQIEAFAILIDGRSIKVTDALSWSSSDNAIAVVGNKVTKSRAPDDPKGLVTGVAQGTAVITGTLATASTTFNASATVIVTAPLLESLQIVPAVGSVPLGTTGAFQAMAYYSDGSAEDVTREAGWLSDDLNVVFVTTTGPNAGDAAAIGEGSTTITGYFGGLSATSRITVTPAAIQSIEVNPVDLTLPVGSSGNYSATAIYSDGSTDDVTTQATWYASDPSVVDIVPNGVNAGFAVMRAEGASSINATYSGITGTTNLTVTLAVITQLQITPANLSAPAGTSGRFEARAIYSDGTDEDVTGQATWQTTEQSILDVITFGPLGGTWYANSVGTVTVSVTYKGVTESTSATVTAAVIESLTVTPQNLSLPVGSSGRYMAQAVYSDDSNKDVTGEAVWTSSDPSVAQIIATGLDAGSLTTLAEGTSTISASLAGITGNSAVTVTPAVITALQVTPSNLSLPAGNTRSYAATAYYSDGTDEDVTKQATWTSSNSSVASVVPSGEEGGFVTARTTGNTDISATYRDTTTSVPLTVTAAVLTSIELSPLNKTIPNGGTQQYLATGIYSDGNSADITGTVTWQSSDLNIATISSNGLATTLSTGFTTISASRDGISNSTTLTVSAAVVTDLIVLPFLAEAYPGDRGRFQAIAYYSDNTSSDVTSQSTWVSSNTSAVVVVPGGESAGFGIAVGVGTSTITASFNGLSASSVVDIVPAVLQSIQIVPVNKSIAKGLQQQYTATGLYSNGKSSDITNSVSWQSGNTAIATIAGNGLADAVDTGTTTISASLDGITASTNITVTAATVTGISVIPFATEAAKGSSGQFEATAFFTDGSFQNVTTSSTWLSDDNLVATVVASGPSGGFVEAVETGSADITATYQGQSASVIFTVTPAVLEEIQVTPASKTVAKGLSVQYTATGIYTDGSNSDLTSSATWTSSDTSVALVNLTGLANTLEVGTTTISAKFTNSVGTLITGTASLEVTAATIRSIQVTPPFSRVNAGTTQKLTAIATYTDNSTQDVSSSAGWTSSDTQIASVINGGNDGGLVTGNTVGVASITANVAGQFSTALIEVTTPLLESIQVTPQDAEIANGLNLQYTAKGVYSDDSVTDISKDVSWQSSIPGVASIDSQGLAKGVSPGTTTVSASLGVVTGTATLDVTGAVVTSVNVIPAFDEANVGQSGDYQLIAYYSDNSSDDVTGQATWQSSETGVATVVTGGEEAGRVSATGVGTADITGTFRDAINDMTFSDTDSLRVNPAVLTSIQVSPLSLTVPAGLAVQYQALGTYSDNSTADITADVSWNSSNQTVATIDLAGLAQTVQTGSTTITASLDGISANTSLSVTAAVVSGLQVLPASATVNAGGVVQLSAQAFFSDNSTEDVTDQAAWTSDDTMVATVLAGEVQTLSAGMAIITAVFGGTTSGTVSLLEVATSTITVNAPVIEDIVIFPGTSQLPLGTSRQFTAFATYSDGSSLDITNLADWQSTNTSVATVSLDGLVSAESIGMTTIDVSYDGLIEFADVEVTNAIIEDVVITPSEIGVPLGFSGRFRATAYYSNDSSSDVTSLASWSSSDTSVVTVVATGTDGGLAQSVSTGTASVMVTFEGLMDTSAVTVTNASLTDILVDPPLRALAVGFSQQYTATGVYSDGGSADITDIVDWQSSSTSVAIIDSDGLLQTVSIGTSLISATTEDITGRSLLAVTPATITTLTVTPPEVDLPAGTLTQLSAVATYSDNSTQVVTTQSSWVSADPATVSVVPGGDDAGNVTALVQTPVGMPTDVTVTYQGFSDTSEITVTPATLDEINIDPPNETTTNGIPVIYSARGVYSDGRQTDLSQEVTWSSDDPDLVSIDQEGVARPSNTLTGTANISASYEGVTGTTPLTVIPIAGERLEITPRDQTIAELTRLQYEATAILNNGTSFPVTELVTWQTTDSDIAVISNEPGNKGLASGTGAGTTTVTAQITYQGDLFTDAVDLSVTPAILDSIIVSADENTIFRNTTTQFYAQGVYQSGATKDITDTVTWSSSDTNVAVISNIASTKGLVIGTGVGTAAITATFLDAKTRTIADSQDIEVIDLNLTALTVEPAGLSTIPVAEELQYTATATLVGGDTTDVTNVAVWGSTDESVAAVSSAGLATASTTPSTTTISATLEGFSDSAQLAVTDSTDVVVAISPLAPRIALGTELEFNASITIAGVPIDGANAAVVWSSTDNDIASVSNQNKQEGLATASGAGTVTISFDYVSAVDNSTYTASTTLEVIDISGLPYTLEIDPKNITISQNDSQQYTLTATWDIGGGDLIVQDVTRDTNAIYDTGDSSIATISTNNGNGKKGELKGIDAGTTTVTGSYSGVDAVTNVTVSP
jgi:uncharacterized protein YjdB